MQTKRVPLSPASFLRCLLPRGSNRNPLSNFVNGRPPTVRLMLLAVFARWLCHIGMLEFCDSARQEFAQDWPAGVEFAESGKTGLKKCANEFTKMVRRICKLRAQNFHFFGAEF